MKYYSQLKPVILLFFILFSLSCTESLKRGLVAYYPFNGNAKDESGNNNNCKVIVAKLTTDRFGENNSAYYFNGDSAMIYTEIKNMTDLRTPHSISWWFYIEDLQTYTDSMGAGNMFALVNSSAGIGVQAGFRAPAYKTSGFDVWKWGGGTFLKVEYPDFQKWHNCTYLFDGKTHRLYYDGREAANSTELPCNGIPTTLMFGNYPSGTQYFKGKLDDIYIYNRILKPEEINKLFTRSN
jgi:trimeric autotransporter adhesin